MRADAGARAHLRMRIDEHVPDATFVNVHAIGVSASATTTWEAIGRAGMRKVPAPAAALLALAALARGEKPRWTVRAMKSWPLRRGDQVGEGALVFEVAAVDEGREVVLVGSHRYADHAVNFFVEPLEGDRSRLWNVTRARFSERVIGRIYRVGVRLFHDLFVRATLLRMRRAAEKNR